VEILAGDARAPGKGVAEMRDDNYRSLRYRREACRCFFRCSALLSRCYVPRFSGRKPFISGC